jgi:hypothetical protein
MIETVMYIGLLAILLPSVILVLLQVQKNQSHVFTKILIEDTSALALSQIQNELIDAQAISISTSTLDSDESIIVYKDDNSQLCEIGFKHEMVEFSGVSYNIGRIYYSGASESWLTPEQITVNKFNAEEVRNQDNVLTGLNVNIEIAPLSEITEMNQSLILNTSTTIYVYPTVQEQ